MDRTFYDKRVFKEYKSRMEWITGEKIKFLQSDREFCNEAFDNFLKIHGVQSHLSVLYTSKQNRVAERMNVLLLKWHVVSCFKEN